MRDEEIKRMVDRFLGWPLPRTFAPDCGISFKQAVNYSTTDGGRTLGSWPIGTNLFTADEARAMFENACGAAAVPIGGLRTVNTDYTDDALLKRVMAGMAVASAGAAARPRWALVHELFALGSTYSKQLCERFGLDPDELVRGRKL